MNRLALVLALAAPAFCQTSFWTSATVPPISENTDTGAVTLGLKFTSDVAGSITAVRFYKGTANTGLHVGNLWSASGTKLATVTFTNETASGWQQAALSPTVAITANSIYIASYRASVGRYASTTQYAWSAINRLPLRVSSTAPGVYAYGSTVLFPNQTWNGSNYYVDVVFVPAAAPVKPTTFAISGTISGANEVVTLSGPVSRSATTSSSRSYSFSSLPNGTYVVSPSQQGHVFTPSTRTTIINGASVNGVNFTVSLGSSQTAYNVDLTWTASTSTDIIGHNVYRSLTAGGPYTRLNNTPVVPLAYMDSNVFNSTTYRYVVTALNSQAESPYSNEVAAIIP